MRAAARRRLAAAPTVVAEAARCASEPQAGPAEPGCLNDRVRFTSVPAVYNFESEMSETRSSRHGVNWMSAIIRREASVFCTEFATAHPDREAAGCCLTYTNAKIAVPEWDEAKRLNLRCTAPRVWPDRIVEENNLQWQISALRAAFGASRNLIRTVSGRGYQFTAEIDTVDGIPEADAGTPIAAAPPDPRAARPDGGIPGGLAPPTPFEPRRIGA